MKPGGSRYKSKKGLFYFFFYSTLHIEYVEFLATGLCGRYKFTRNQHYLLNLRGKGTSPQTIEVPESIIVGVWSYLLGIITTYYRGRWNCFYQIKLFKYIQSSSKIFIHFSWSFIILKWSLKLLAFQNIAIISDTFVRVWR